MSTNDSNNDIESSSLDTEALRAQIRQELEAEHQDREERAKQRSHRRKERQKKNKQRSKEVDAIRAEMRRAFYKEHGYEEKVDPTGRKMYLSPAELENKKKRHSGKRRSKKQRNSIMDVIQGSLYGDWLIYAGVAVIAMIVALLVVRG